MKKTTVSLSFYKIVLMNIFNNYSIKIDNNIINAELQFLLDLQKDNTYNIDDVSEITIKSVNNVDTTKLTNEEIQKYFNIDIETHVVAFAKSLTQKEIFEKCTLLQFDMQAKYIHNIDNRLKVEHIFIAVCSSDDTIFTQCGNYDMTLLLNDENVNKTANEIISISNKLNNTNYTFDDVKLDLDLQKEYLQLNINEVKNLYTQVYNNAIK